MRVWRCSRCVSVHVASRQSKYHSFTQSLRTGQQLPCLISVQVTLRVRTHSQRPRRGLHSKLSLLLRNHYLRAYAVGGSTFGTAQAWRPQHRCVPWRRRMQSSSFMRPPARTAASRTSLTTQSSPSSGVARVLGLRSRFRMHSSSRSLCYVCQRVTACTACGSNDTQAVKLHTGSLHESARRVA